MSTQPTVFLDRDGTIIIDKHYLHDPAGVEFLPNALRGLRLMQEKGFRLVVVTNQSGVGRGLFTLEDAQACNDRLARMCREQGVEIAAFYLCPHEPEAQCDCRKPATGMIEQAAEDFDFDPAYCWVVGDKCADVNLGRNAEIRTMLVRTGKGLDTEMQKQCTPDLIADDLLLAAQLMD